MGSGVREVPGKCAFGEGEQGSVAKIRQDKELAPLSCPFEEVRGWSRGLDSPGSDGGSMKQGDTPGTR